MINRNSISVSIALLLVAIIMSSCTALKGVPSPYNNDVANTHHKKEKSEGIATILLENLCDWQERVCREAISWIGTPYKSAESSKGFGTDCSGLVMQVFEHTQGWQLPRNSAQQAEYCQRIHEKDTRPCDLVFFATGSDKSQISHVGIMIDKENFIHASSSKGVVVSSMQNEYYKNTFLMYGRLPQINSELK